MIGAPSLETTISKPTKNYFNCQLFHPVLGLSHRSQTDCLALSADDIAFCRLGRRNSDVTAS